MKILSLFEEYTGNSKVQPTTDLTNPWALDCNGNPILPENAERHGNYTCPKCHEPLNVRKRGKGEHSRRDHFYHKADTACRGFTPHETESYIHKTAKAGIFKILQELINKSEPFPITWTCPTCKKQFSGNLLHYAKSVKIEKQFEDKADGQDHKQPDVSLIDENGKLLVAIEVVYTHDVEQNTLSLYERKSIILVRLNFRSVEDLNDIEQKLHNPDSVNICLNVKCIDCQSSHLPKLIIPLQNKKGENAAVAVAIRNPFDDLQQNIWGLPFSEHDMQKAIEFVRLNWPDVQINLQPAEQSGLYLAIFVASQLQRLVVPRELNPYGTGLDTMMAKKERQNYMIRKTYAKLAKKSGGKRHR